MTNKYTKLLYLFVSKEDNEMRDWLTQPLQMDNYAIATDAHSIVFFDKKLLPEGRVFSDKPEKVDIASIIKYEPTEHFAISLQTLKEVVSKLPSEEGICEYCRGSGKVTWRFLGEYRKEHTKEDDCPVCDARVHPALCTRVLIKKCRFKPSVIRKLAEAVVLMGCSEIILVHQPEPGRNSFFKLGEDVEIMFSPAFIDKREDKIVYEIK